MDPNQQIAAAGTILNRNLEDTVVRLLVAAT
jgi:hypothetical protein